MEHLDPNDPLNHYFATDLAAITEDLEFDGYESPPEPDASAYEKALDDVAHKAAVANNYDPHAIDKAVHDAEREVWWLDQAIRGLVGMVEDGIQPEPHTLVAPLSVRARLNAELSARTDAMYPPSGPYTEFDITRRFVKSRGNEFRYCDKDWRYFNGRGWIDGAEAKVFKAVKLHCSRIRVVGQRNDPLIVTPKRAQEIESIAMVRKVVSSAQSDLHTRPDQWDADPMLLGTLNGIVDLRTGEFYPGRRDLVVMRTTVDPLPPTRDADPFTQCPEWGKFLWWAVQRNAELLNYIQRMFGYTLTGDYSEQCVFFLQGPPSHGKGTVISTLRGILGAYGKTADRRVFSEAKSGYERHSTELAALKNSRMASFNETQEIYTWDSEKLKSLTGGDDLTARRIAKDNTEFKPTFKFWFSSNFEPVVRSDDGAMRRRLRLIIFNAPRDPNIPDDTLLPEKLRKEYPGILRWAIDGCRAWQFGRNEYGSGLKEPKVVVDAVNELFGREDAFDEFLDECCQKDLTYQVETLQLWNAWKAYAEARGELKKYPSDTAMRNALTARGYQKSKAVSTRRSIFKGLRLK